MTVQASNNQPTLNSGTELNVPVARAIATDREAMEAQSVASVRAHFGDMLPPALSSELRPSADFTSAVAAAVDLPIREDARAFVLAKIAERGLDGSPAVAGVREQYARPPQALTLAA